RKVLGYEKKITLHQPYWNRCHDGSQCPHASGLSESLLAAVLLLLGFPFRIGCSMLLLRIVHRAVSVSADLADFTFLSAFSHDGIGSVLAGFVLRPRCLFL